MTNLINIDAEQSLIGAILIQPAIIAEGRNLVRADDFYTDRFRPILHAVCEMEGAGEIIDGVTVGNRLKLDGKGKNELLTLVQSCPSAANWEAYAKIVLEKAQKRSEAQIVSDLAEGRITRSEAIEKLSRLEAQNRTGKAGELPVIALASLPEPEPTPYLIEKMQPLGHIALWHARGGKGKSALALTAGCCVSLGVPFAGLKTRPGKVLYLDWELSPEEQTRRIHQVIRGIGCEWASAGIEANFHYLAPGFQEGIPSRIEEVAQLVRGKGYDFVIVDSLGAACPRMKGSEDIVPIFQAELVGKF